MLEQWKKDIAKERKILQHLLQDLSKPNAWYKRKRVEGIDTPERFNRFLDIEYKTLFARRLYIELYKYMLLKKGEQDGNIYI